jgi:hypothetical protein
MTPYKFGAPKEFTREQLEVWINQMEDLSGKTSKIHVNQVSKMTVLTVDLDTPKPSPAKLQMGHISAGGSNPIEGVAYVLGQVMDVTVLR